jgi:hypothetical protein
MKTSKDLSIEECGDPRGYQHSVGYESVQQCAVELHKLGYKLEHEKNLDSYPSRPMFLCLSTTGAASIAYINHYLALGPGLPIQPVSETGYA